MAAEKEKKIREMERKEKERERETPLINDVSVNSTPILDQPYIWKEIKCVCEIKARTRQSAKRHSGTILSKRFNL